MHYKDIAQIEKTFPEQPKFGRRAYKLTPFQLPVPEEDFLMLDGYVCRRSDGVQSYYYDGQHPKKNIVLHYTAGNFKGDLPTLTKKNYHVSTAYLIARDGTIYQLFDPKYWSYHVGPGALGGNKTQSSRSIGIELSNYGWLTINGENMDTAYAEHGDAPFCTLWDTELVHELGEPFRGHQFFTRFTSRQYNNLIILLRYLTAKFDIPRAFLSEPERYQTTEEVIDFEGICSHVNFRTDKWDIGPAFEWEKVIEGVVANTYQSIKPIPKGMQDGTLQSEEEMEEQFVPTDGNDFEKYGHGEDGL